MSTKHGIFAYKIVSAINPRATSLLRNFLETLSKLQLKRSDTTVLGTYLASLLPKSIRKTLGAFYTHYSAATLLATLALQSPHEKVADLACGSGTLLLAAYRRMLNLQNHSNTVLQKNYKVLQTEITGIEIMPFAAILATALLTTQEAENKIQFIPIKIADALFCNELETVDTILMNPPYTRQEKLSKEYKSRLVDRFREYRNYQHRQMSYYGYFIFLADEILKKNGRLALILPAAFLRTRSTKGLRQLLSERYEIEFVIYPDFQLNFSEATWRREIILIVRKLAQPRQPPTKSKIPTWFITLHHLPENTSQIYDVGIQLTSCKLKTEAWKHPSFTALPIQPDVLIKTSDWLHFIPLHPTQMSLNQILANICDQKPQFSLFHHQKAISHKGRRGVETARGVQINEVLIGHPLKHTNRTRVQWFVDTISDTSTHIQHRTNSKHLIIPNSHLIAALKSTQGQRTMTLDQTSDYLLVDLPSLDTKSVFFSQQEPTDEVFENWKKYVKNRQGNLLLLRRFPLLSPSTYHLCYYSPCFIAGPGTTWVFQLPDKLAQLSCLWFNSSLHLYQILHNGIEDLWLDVHWYLLKDFYVPDFSSLTNNEKSRLLSLYVKLSQIAFPPLLNQYIPVISMMRQKLDNEMLFALGFSKSQANSLLERVYSIICSRLRELSSHS
jgi:tRNA1(Val) A37 N6-methylase TrmN6